MTTTEFELEQPCIPPPGLGGLADTELLATTAATQVAENANRARRLQLMAALHARCQQEHDTELADAIQPRFVPTPLQATAAELAPLLAITETTVAHQLNTYAKLTTWFPKAWQACLSGRLSVGKAEILLDAAASLANPDDIAEFADLMDDYFTKRDDPSAPLIPLTRHQITNAARYRKAKFPQKDTTQTFTEAFCRRRVTLRTDENGIGFLGLSHAAHQLTALDYRLTLIAKKLAEADTEDRSLDQLRADAIVDLLTGRLTVDATDADLEAHHTVDGADPATGFHHHPPGAYARPVINLTVPIQTVLGLADTPGILSGDTVIPADLARHIAADPTSTWYRLLTDPAGGFAELSTHSYQPTPAIWRTVVAKQRTCIWPGCPRPAVGCHLDHRREWPDGHTHPANLEPLCPRHHRLKHADGFTIEGNDDDSYTITTRRGSTFHTHPSQQPLTTWPNQPDDRPDDQADDGPDDPDA